MNTPLRLGLAAALALVWLPAQAAPENPLSQVRVDVSEDAQPLRDVLQRLQVAHGLNYVVNEKVLAQAGTVTVHLRNVRLDVALESILSACGLALEIRDEVLVVLPKRERQGPLLPEVEHGLTRRVPEQTPFGEPAPRAPAPAPQAAGPAEPREVLAHCVGTLQEVNVDEERMTLLVDGVKRNFYVPKPDPSDPTRQRDRLMASLPTLKPGSRIALEYRRDPTRPEVTNLVGGAYAGTRHTPAPAQPPERGAQAKKPAGKATEAPPALPSESGPALEGEGILFGSFVELKDEVVKIRRADGEVVACYLPGKDEAARRDKVQKAVKSLEAGKRIGVTYEDRDGRRTIRDTIIQAN